MGEHTSYNWCPKTHEEFRKAFSEDRVGLGFGSGHELWLRENVLSHSLWKSLLGEPYEKRLLFYMANNEKIFWKVHDKGIDLILYPKK